MRRDTHERALLATAKIAAAAALLGSGCSGSTQTPAGPEPGPAETPTAEVDASDGAPMQPVATPDGEAAAAPNEAPSEDSAADLKACTEKVNAAVAAKQKGADDSMKACCQTIAEDYDKREAAWMGDERFYCCDALNWQGSRACTPWGPPMPPELSWGLA